MMPLPAKVFLFIQLLDILDIIMPVGWYFSLNMLKRKEGKKGNQLLQNDWLALLWRCLMTYVPSQCFKVIRICLMIFWGSLISTHILLKCFFEIFDFATQIELFWKKKSYFQTLWPQANDCLKRKQTCNRRMDAFYTTFKYCWCHLALILNQDQKRSALCLSSDWIISPKAELEACPLSVKTQMLPSQGQFWFSSIIAQEKN